MATARECAEYSAKRARVCSGVTETPWLVLAGSESDVYIHRYATLDPQRPAKRFLKAGLENREGLHAEMAPTIECVGLAPGACTTALSRLLEG